MEDSPKIVTYHDLAKIGIKEIFYFFSENGWKHDEKMIETIDGQEWDYNKFENTYTLRKLKLQEV